MGQVRQQEGIRVGMPRAPHPAPHDSAAPSRLVWRMAVALVLLLALSSCGGETRLALPATATPAGDAGVPPTPAIEASPVPASPAFEPVVWTTGTDPATNAPIDTVTGYSTSVESIIAAVRASHLPRGASVTAKWTYNDTSLDALATSLTAEGSAEDQWLSFRLDRDPDVPWPAGAYAITVLLNGSPVQQATVEVTAPE